MITRIVLIEPLCFILKATVTSSKALHTRLHLLKPDFHDVPRIVRVNVPSLRPSIKRRTTPGHQASPTSRPTFRNLAAASKLRQLLPTSDTTSHTKNSNLLVPSPHTHYTDPLLLLYCGPTTHTSIAATMGSNQKRVVRVSLT
jgi:hypothetical protein